MAHRTAGKPAVAPGVPCTTTLQAAEAAVKAMEALREEMEVVALKDLFGAEVGAGRAAIGAA